MTTIAFIVAAYLIGSLSFAVIVSRAMGLADPRTFGSGNPGATNVLRTGAEGIYGAEAINKLPSGMAQRYFDRLDEQRWQAKPALRQMIRFQPLNLVDPQWSIRGPFDAIFCRNVMIYFDRDTQLTVLRRFAPLLKPDGLLFVGHSENFYHATDLFRLRGKTVYERVNAL